MAMWSSKMVLIVLMLIQLTEVSAKIGTVSAELGSATNATESLLGKAQDVHVGIRLGGSVLAAIVIVLGAVILIFGFRLIRAALFVVGFLVGGIGIALLAERMFRDETWLVLASWVAFGVGGILCGVLITWLYPLSTFVAGAATGIITAMIITNTFGYMIYPGHTTDLLTLMCVVLGIVFGVLALKVGKPVLIISTSLIGSCMVVWGVGYFAGQFPNAHDLEQYASKDIDGKLVYSIPDAWWGYLAGIVVLFAFGVYIQFKKTARNVKDNRPKGFGKQKDVNEYIERKTARNKTQDSLDMEAPPRRQRQVRRQKEFQEQRQPRQVREVREVRAQPNKKRSIKQQAPPSPQYTNAPSRQYADLGATDEIIEYEERMPQQKRIIYSDRESDLYDFESNRDPCRFCGDYVHLDGSCCTEKTVRLDRH